MSSAISAKFSELKGKARRAFVPFVTAGDPDLEMTIRLIPELERAGSDIVELGIPFSDPVADGPVIQRSSERALKHGYHLADYLSAVKSIRRESAVPIVLFSYFNPILQYGLERLAQDARSAGVDGILVTDMIPEESDAWCACLERHELDPIFLAAPTSNDRRVELIARCSRGFIYLVSRTGITGQQENLSDSIGPTLQRVRRHSALPIAVGFGVSRPEHVREIWKIADGAVVGSAIVAQIERRGHSPDLPSQIAAFCRWLTGTAGTWE